MKKPKRASLNRRTGLVLSLTPLTARLKRLFPHMIVRKDATVYLCALVECILTDLILGGAKHRTRREKELLVRHVYKSISENCSYARLFRDCTFNFDESTNISSLDNDI